MTPRPRLALFAIVLLFAILACTAPVALAPAGGAPVSATQISPTLLTPPEFTSHSRDLVQVVADLNLAQLAFIRDAAGTPPAGLNQLDGELVEIARISLQTGQIATLLGQTAVAQGGPHSQTAGQIADLDGRLGLAGAAPNPAPAQIASQYFGLARFGYGLELATQSIRSGLARGSLTPAKAAGLVAQGGAQLWNPAVGKPDAAANPFAPFVPSAAPAPAPALVTGAALANLLTPGSSPLLSWVSTSANETSTALTVPAPTAASAAAGNLFDPTSPLTVNPSNGNLADQTALSQLILLGAQVAAPAADGSQVVTVSTPNSAIVAAGGTPARSLPVVPGGSAVAVSQPSGGDLLSSLIALDDGNKPSVTAQVPVTDSKPIVDLTISNITITRVTPRSKDLNSSFEADVTYEFDLTWGSNLTDPQFILSCSDNNTIDITRSTGITHFTAKGLMELYPGEEVAYCYATHKGETWASTSASFLVGDASQATLRADKLSTDMAIYDLTLTAQALGTSDELTASAAGTDNALVVQNAVSTEVAGTQTAEFRATITAIARLTAQALPPPPTYTPQPTATFTPVLLESFPFPGNLMAMSTKGVMQRGRLYRICMSGLAITTTGSWSADQIMHINGAKIPPSGCVTFEGNNAPAAITCGGNGQDLGEAAADPGAYAVEVYDLGPY